MATFAAALHQRVASPVTPAHSPQPSQHSLHSTSSTRSHTPVHSLSLHEYRKKQASPGTPEPPGGKRVKRKAAATRLNTAERVPPVPPVPRAPAVPSPPSSSGSDTPRAAGSPPFTGLQVSSFRSLPALQQRTSLSLRDLAKLNASAADLAPGASQSASLPLDFGKTLRSRKRLPRPKDIQIHRPPTASPVRSDPSSLDLISTAGLASTSTFTLSKYPFPEPPRSHTAAPDNAPLNVWPPESNPADITPSLLDTPPATPAVLHYRGTSFNVVNPHHSLYLSNLETPADHDQDHDDYFHRTSLDSLLPSNMDPSPPASIAEKPQRSLYNDLQAAHQSITKSKVQDVKTTASQTELPLPSRTVMTMTPPEKATANLQPLVTSPTSNKKLGRRESFLGRARTVWGRRKGKDTHSKPDEEEGQELQAIPYEATFPSYRSPITGPQHASAPVVHTQDLSEEAPRASADTWQSVSDGAVDAYYDYDKVSMYDDNADYESTSLYFGPMSNRCSLPFGVQNQITDYSGEVTYAFGDTPRQSLQRAPRRSVRKSAAQPGGDQLFYPPPKTADNTLNSIYDQYGEADGNNASFLVDDVVTDDEDDDAATIRVPSLRSMIPSGPQAPDRTSGLSQFDFDLDQVRHSGSNDSPVTSPVTPQESAFPKRPAMLRTSSGAPPRAPPPLVPEPLFAQQTAYPHISTDMSNKASSYGDTRKLLNPSDLHSPVAKRMSSVVDNNRDVVEPEEQYSVFPERVENKRNSQISVQSGTSVKSDDGKVSGNAYFVAEEGNIHPSARSRNGLRKQAMITNADLRSGGDHDGIPAMWRAASPGAMSPRNDSPATMMTEYTDGDWETIAPTASRRDCSYDDSFMANDIDDTANGQHSRETSGGQSLRRKPSCEDLTPKRSNTNPWRKTAVPDSASDHPFGSSPPQASNIPRFPRESQMSFLRNSDHIRHSNRRATDPSVSNDSLPVHLSDEQMNNFLAYGPSEEILEEQQESPLARRSQLRDSTFNIHTRDFASSSSSAQRGSRMNSFDKYTVVGPKANLTGTPMGTGMRETGSSTVGPYSSPPTHDSAYKEIFGSSPPVPYTPARQGLLRSNETVIHSPTGGKRFEAGYYANYRTPPTYVPSPLARGSIVSSQSSRVPTIGSYGRDLDRLRSDSSIRASRYYHAKTRSRASSANAPTGAAPAALVTPRTRASVRSMTAPRPFQLQPADLMTLHSERSGWNQIVRPESTQTAQPLTPYAAFRFSPHLNQIPRPNSSSLFERAQKKTALSWAIFATCAWFPPTALLLFLGALDGLMFHVSNREIYHVGQFQKKFALVAFVIEVVGLVVVLILWLVHVI